MSLEQTDTRTLQTQMRGVISDTTRMGMIAAGTRNMILLGNAPWVADMVRVLEDIDGKEPLDYSAGPDGLPTPNMPLDYSGVRVTNLKYLVEDFAQSLGIRLPIYHVTAPYQAVEFDLPKRDTVPAVEVYSFVESLLKENGYALAYIDSSDQPQLGLFGHRRLKDFAYPVPVLPEDVVDFAEGHPALLIRTLISLRNADARSLQATLRNQVTQTSTQTLLGVGADKILVMGMAPWVHEMTKLIQASDH